MPDTTDLAAPGAAMPVQEMPKKYSPMKKEMWKRGFPKSQERLLQLRFDPIKELVNLYHRLKAEDVYHQKVRDGSIVPLTAAGKVRPYNADAHLAVLDKLQKTASDLLRYGYGRVPESVSIEPGPSGLVINLTREGDVYEINPVRDGADGD